MGHIRKRGDSLQLLYYYEGKQRSRTVKTSLREAKKLLNEIERSIDLGTYDDGSKKVVTVGDVLRLWLADIEGRKAPTTLDRYKSVVKNHLMTEFGGFDLQALGPRQIDAVYKGWIHRGLSGRTIGLYHACLSSALGYALRMEMVGRNAASLVKPPPHTVGEAQKILDDDGLALVLKSDITRPYAAQAKFCLLTGMRVGESCALRWSDVDFASGMVNVSGTAARLSGGKVIVKEPKTRSSKRSVALPPEGKSLLLSIVRTGEFVFGGESPVPPANASVGIRRLLASMGIDMTSHGLRHSHASRLARMGVHPRLVADRLGHSSPNLSIGTYTHSTLQEHKDVASGFTDGIMTS